jgi:SAM-dependent methyltransferase
MDNNEQERIRKTVRKHYGDAAQGGQGCCGSGGDASLQSYQQLGYSAGEVRQYLGDVKTSTQSCGNPLLIANVKAGETVLDLGSGRGLDCFMAAQRVGPEGKVIGVDMTPEVVSMARKTVMKSGLENIEIRLGEIENLPVADACVDVIMSNCVINLSPDKRKVFADAFRVLKPGGRLAISDVVATRPIPDKMKNDDHAYACCIGGAATIDDLTKMLDEAGFVEIRIEPYEKSREIIESWEAGDKSADFVVSAAVTASKPIKP